MGQAKGVLFRDEYPGHQTRYFNLTLLPPSNTRGTRQLHSYKTQSGVSRRDPPIMQSSRFGAGYLPCSSTLLLRPCSGHFGPPLRRATPASV